MSLIRKACSNTEHDSIQWLVYFEIIVNSKYYLLHCVSLLSEEVNVFNSYQIALSSSSRNFTKLNQNQQWGEITFEVVLLCNYTIFFVLHRNKHLNT